MIIFTVRNDVSIFISPSCQLSPNSLRLFFNIPGDNLVHDGITKKLPIMLKTIQIILFGIICLDRFKS